MHLSPAFSSSFPCMWHAIATLKFSPLQPFDIDSEAAVPINSNLSKNQNILTSCLLASICLGSLMVIKSPHISCGSSFLGLATNYYLYPSPRLKSASQNSLAGLTTSLQHIDMHGKCCASECEDTKQPTCLVTIRELGKHRASAQGVEVDVSKS